MYWSIFRQNSGAEPVAKPVVKPGVQTCAIAAGILLSIDVAAAALSLERAQALAIEQDPGRKQLTLQSRAAEALGVAESQWADPQLIIGAQNFPADTLDFDQEPMTQLRVAIRQQLPQGDTLSLQQDRQRVRAAIMLAQASARQLMVRREVRALWLEIYELQRVTAILQDDEGFLKQLRTITRSLYEVGRVQQQDFLRAELELSRLEQQLLTLKGQEAAKRTALSRWIGATALSAELPSQAPVLDGAGFASADLNAADIQSLPQGLREHPVLNAVRLQADESSVDVALAREKYAPAFGVELAYGARGGSNLNGSERSGLVSAAVTMTLPLFTAQRQDRQLESAVYRESAAEYAWTDKLRAMAADAAAAIARLRQVESEIGIYDKGILQQAKLEAKATINAYQANAADFSEVMRSFLNEQKDRLSYWRLKVKRLQILSELEYLIPSQSARLSSQRGGTAQ